VARAPDGRVVFVRHTLPGERVLARVTDESSSFLRADAVEVIRASAERVAAPCPYAGPGRCGGCDWQHVSLPAQRTLKEDLITEQLRRLARIDRPVPVEEVEGASDGLAWRTRVRFAVDPSGRTGFHRHRSGDVEPVETCAIAASGVNALGVGSVRWRGARHVEVTAPPDGGRSFVSLDTGRARMIDEPEIAAGLVVNGRAQQEPSSAVYEVLGHQFAVSAGVFWQVHPGGAAVLTRAVLDGLAPAQDERVLDLYAGAGLFTVACAWAVGPGGSVTAVERSARACADAVRNSAELAQVQILRSEVTASVVAERLGQPDLVVLDPARQGAGLAVMRSLAELRPGPRALAYVSCDPASFARDLRILLDAGWSVASLRAFDLFPMTAHVELVGILTPPPGPGSPGTGGRGPAQIVDFPPAE
jgi:tRNA/tmRNA/rRNA uracil-C5-methylase (TrmA/RlmC/RlmD family)